MTDFNFKVDERVTRQEAAEQLMDIAYALAAGAPLELRADAGRVSIPVADELRLERESRSTGRRIELDLQLIWSNPYPPIRIRSPPPRNPRRQRRREVGASSPSSRARLTAAVRVWTSSLA